MTNNREPPNQAFDQAVSDVAAFLNFDDAQFAISIGTDPSMISGWRHLTLGKMDEYRSIRNTSFKFDGLLLQRRILICKLNEFRTFLHAHMGSESKVRQFLVKPWIDNAYATSLRDIAMEDRGLEKACAEIEEWLKKNTDFTHTA